MFVIVALQIVVVGLHSGVEEVGPAYHHPIELGSSGKLHLVFLLQLTIERAMCTGMGDGVYHRREQAYVVELVGVIGCDMDGL